MTNRIDTTLTPEQVAAAEAALKVLDDILAFAVALNAADRRALKLGDKSEPFVTKAVEAAKQHPEAIPGGIKVDQIERDLTLHGQLKSLSRRAAPILRKLEDTAFVVGGEALQGALLIYGAVQTAAKHEPGLVEVMKELGKRFERQSPRTDVTENSPS